MPNKMAMLVNTTFHVHRSADIDFHDWVNGNLIPSAISSGIFHDALVSRILVDMTPDTNSYAVQFKAAGQQAARKWFDEAFPQLLGQITARHGEAVLCFTTFMEIIHYNER